MKIENERLRIEVEDLGVIEVYRAKGGYACDINGKRAWSGWRGNIREIQQTLRVQIKAWQYLNGFKIKK